jgi:hypothetical protein
MNTCATCHYWDAPKAAQEKWGSCLCPALHSEHYDHWRDTLTWPDDHAILPEGCLGWPLMTGRDFGCVQWKGKPCPAC